MRIVQITDNYPPNHKGGAEISCKLITDELRLRGHDVFVITNKTLPAQIDADGIFYLNSSCFWGCKNLINLKNNFENLQKKIKEIKPDIIHIHLFENNLQGALILSKFYPVVYTAHNYTLEIFKYLKFEHFIKNIRDIFSDKILIYLKHLIRLDHKYIKEMITENIPNIKKIICPSRFMGERLQKIINHEQLEIVHNGVPDIYCNRKVVNNPFEMLFAGRIEKNKGVGYIIESARQLTAMGEDISVVLIGSGGYIERAKRLIIRYGLEDKIKIIPHISKINYLEYDGIVIYPSIWDENCSMTILEALSAGKIVICTARGGNKELIEDLYNGLIINQKDYNAITKKMLILKKYPGLINYFSFNARQTFLSKFAIKKQVDQIENIYKNILV